MQGEGLDNYPEILKLLDSDSAAIKLVKQALLNDRVLRPVFMQVLPVEKTGKMEICNKQLAAEKIKWDKTLADYIMENKGIFLCGKNSIKFTGLGDETELDIFSSSLVIDLQLLLMA